MPGLYPPIVANASGMLGVGDGNAICWETSGNPDGVPAVVLHGGPGSGCTPGMRRFFDPKRYRIVLFDQRGCGRSRPHASDPATDLSVNKTEYLIRDIEALRDHLGIERWLIFGHSWGSVLGSAYAERHPQSVSHAVLAGVGTGRRAEIDQLYRGLAPFYPAAWARFVAGVPKDVPDFDLLEAYRRLLEDPDAAVRERAARAFSAWEWASAAPDSPPPPHWLDPAFQLARSRIVTHYFTHGCWIDDGSLLDRAGLLCDIPAIIVNGEFDPLAPLRSAEALVMAWPGAELVIVEGAGHTTASDGMTDAIVAATDRMAGSGSASI